MTQHKGADDYNRATEISNRLSTKLLVGYIGPKAHYGWRDARVCRASYDLHTETDRTATIWVFPRPEIRRPLTADCIRTGGEPLQYYTLRYSIFYFILLDDSNNQKHSKR